jgi:hypothetical protein
LNIALDLTVDGDEQPDDADDGEQGRHVEPELPHRQ